MIVDAAGFTVPVLTGVDANSPVIGWHTLVTATNVAASSADPFYPVSNLANPSTALLWRAADDSPMPSEITLTVTFAVDTDVDYVAIARHNFATIGADVAVEGVVAGDSPAVWVELIADTTLDDDAPAIFRFSSDTFAAVRLRLSGFTGVPECAILYAGELLWLQRRIYVGHTPLPLGRSTAVINARSENGAFLGRIVTGQTLETQVALQNLQPAWYRAELDPFVVAAAEAPFFFAWRPGAFPLETGFAWLTNQPKPQNARNNGMMSVTLQMAGIAT